jgi:TolB-like protein/class 3 adenylate cyclase
MVTAGVERRLLAILAADVVGYSHLMEVDEPGTIARLKEVRAEITDPLVSHHGGRIVKLMGDGAIVIFESIVDAVACAIAVQRNMAKRNAALPEIQRIIFRIGVNLGDIALVDGDVYGHGVNVAARLEQLCAPGGVTLSGTAVNHIRGKLDLWLDYLGEHRVKNIDRPVPAYRVRLDGVPLKRIWRYRALTQKAVALAAVIFVILVLGIGGWWFWPTQEGAHGRSSIAVLPFENLGSDEQSARLADGITEDVITDLARFWNLEVIARNSTMVYKGKPVDVRQVGRDLNVSYVLEGSVQRRADNIRITAQLIDAPSGAHLWSDRWDRPVEDTFVVQTEVAERVAGSLGSINSGDAISAEETRRIKRRAPASLTAYDNYLLAVEAKGQFTKEAIFAGIDFANKAIALDPDFARAYAVRARLDYNTSHYGVDYETAMQMMERDARRAVELDPSDPEARAALAWYLNIRGRLAEFEVEVRAALRENPENVSVLIIAAAGLAWSGHPEEGAALTDKVLRIDPRASSGTLNTIKDAYFFTRRYDDAVAVISRIPEDARGRGSRVLLTASYALLGRQAELARAKADLLAHYPSISAELLLNEGWAFARPQEENLLLDGFRAANLPVCGANADLATIPKARRLPECVRPTATAN